MHDFQEILAQGPLLLVVSGAPGSGKTTLAKVLAERLRMVHIERDVLLEHLYQLHKNNPKYDRATVGVKKVYSVVWNMLEHEVSVVMDATLYNGKSEQDIARFSSVAQVVNIHCRGGDKEVLRKRFREREIGRDGTKPDWLDGHMRVLDDIYDDVVDSLVLNCPQIEVETEKEYTPSIEKIVDWLLEQR